MARAHHVVPNAQDGGWDVKAEGEFEPIRHFRRKEDAVDFARGLSRIEMAELIVHDEPVNPPRGG
ncbi:MAG: DUF2188 domain-containing protein [Deltaproteobacteria bacterium]|nr:DUF2188 domain-containing protein [Deltaproteobacteria bacterium]